jgi:hypothetical protein
MSPYDAHILDEILQKIEKNSDDVRDLCLYSNLTLPEIIELANFEKEYIKEYKEQN